MPNSSTRKRPSSGGSDSRIAVVPPPQGGRTDQSSNPLAGSLGTLLIVFCGGMIAAGHLVNLLGERRLATQFVSEGLWQRLVMGLGGRLVARHGVPGAELSSGGLAFIGGLAALVAWFGLTSVIAWRRRARWREVAAAASWAPFLALWLPLVWEAAAFVALLASSMTGPTPLLVIEALAMPSVAVVLALFGLLCVAVLARAGERSASASTDPSRSGVVDDWRVARAVWGLVVVSTLVWGFLNQRLYENLLIPHGDSAMYEEHLWNVLHSKGFRSYLDNGRLFLGEHVQVAHLLLIPAYLVWPSHLLLEWSQSAVLASGAVPVYWLGRRHTGSATAGLLLAGAYLLYSPMHFLDIAVDFKTFRPSAIEIPAFLFAVDAIERRRFAGGVAWLMLALSGQEDAAPIVAPLGVWLCGVAWLEARQRQPSLSGSPNLENATAATFAAARDRAPWWRSSGVCLGAGMAVFGTLYLVLVVKVVLPYFRGGADVHYASYFKRLGGSTSEILTNVVRQPGLFVEAWAQPEVLLFAVALLVPLGGLAVLAPSRLAVAIPLFAVLSLNEIARNTLHHFHAPLVPIVLWATAAGVGRFGRLMANWRPGGPADAFSGGPRADRRLPHALYRWLTRRLPLESRAPAGASAGTTIHPSPHGETPPVSEAVPTGTEDCPHAGALVPITTPTVGERAWSNWAAGLACACAFTTGFFGGLHPLSLPFWDPFSRVHWRQHYGSSDRAKHLSTVLEAVPPQSRVASTDFIHPRFTHHERSYDYSDYRPHPPTDTDFIVIDTRHPYSSIRGPDDIKELRQSPAEWELLPDRTDGAFLILRKKRRDGNP